MWSAIGMVALAFAVGVIGGGAVVALAYDRKEQKQCAKCVELAALKSLQRFKDKKIDHQEFQLSQCLKYLPPDAQRRIFGANE